MKKYATLLLFLALALSATFVPATAKERSPQDIARIAKRLIAPAAVKRSMAAGKVTPELKKLSATKAYTVMGYDDGGFAIIANDDANTPVVGYSADNLFATDNPALSWYLSMAEQKLNDRAMAAPHRAVRVPSGCKTSVSHLVESKWDQGKPYNSLCPKNSSGRNCVTGCVATAMAQILYYHKYPTTGKGTNFTFFENKKYTVDYSQATYNFDDLLPDYSNGFSVTQKRAIATLMYHCGVAAHMTYGIDVSGAYLYDAADGLVDNFGYYAQYYGYKDYPEPNNYDNAMWCEVVYREISAGNPVLYAGGSKYNGTAAFHCFVLDGYDANGNVGVNWGYSGRGDGYFRLDAMDCIIGTYHEQYSYSFDMVVVHRPEQGPVKYDLVPVTGIRDINAEANEAAPTRVYDAAGRQIDANRAQKGLVIERQGNQVRKVLK